MRFYNGEYTFYYIYNNNKKLIEFMYKESIVYKHSDTN